MKRFFILLTAGLASLSLLSSCMIIDWAPVELEIYVVDENGSDRLDPSAENFIGHDISLEYRDEIYGLKINETTYYMPNFTGLQLYHSEKGYYLCFGELDGANDYDDNFIITWPDGTRDVIYYKRTVWPLVVQVSERWKLNGKKTDMPVTITK